MVPEKRVLWCNSFFGGRILVLRTCAVLHNMLNMSDQCREFLQDGHLIEARRHKSNLHLIFMHFLTVHSVVVGTYNFSYMSLLNTQIAMRMGMRFYQESHMDRMLDYELDA